MGAHLPSDLLSTVLCLVLHLGEPVLSAVLSHQHPYPGQSTTRDSPAKDDSKVIHELSTVSESSVLLCWSPSPA